MTYAAGKPSVELPDRACVQELLVEAIYHDDDLPEKRQVHSSGSVRLSAGPLPGRGEPLGFPGGAAGIGLVGAGAPSAAALPPQR